MFIEREMSRDRVAAIIWTGVTSQSEDFFILEREMHFAHIDFQIT